MEISFRFEEHIKKAFSLMGFDCKDANLRADIKPDIEESSFNTDTEEVMSASEVTLYGVINGKYQVIGFFECIIKYTAYDPTTTDVTLINTTPIGNGKIVGTTVNFKEEL